MSYLIIYFEVTKPSFSVCFFFSGAFHFNIWRFGEWVDIVVDDRMPMLDGRHLFCGPMGSAQELWGPLVEKAYAKYAGFFFPFKMGLSRFSHILDKVIGCANFLAERKTGFCDKHAWLTGLLAYCRTACLCFYLFVLFVCQAVKIFSLQFQTSEDAFLDIQLSNVTKNSLHSQDPTRLLYTSLLLFDCSPEPR